MPTQPKPIGSEEALRSMLDELHRAEPVYLPSRFWEFHGGSHLELLRKRGLVAFKQTLNMSYYNWLPKSWDDNQLRNLLSLWQRNPGLAPIQAHFTSRPELEWVHDGIPLTADEEWTIHAFFVGLLWDYAARTDRYSLLSTLEEPRIGKPFPIEMNGKWISQDLANSVREYNAIRPALEAGDVWDDRLTLGELGAGYGRLAYVMAKAAPGRYLIFDIPPTLHVSQWYLSRVCPEKQIFAFRHFDDFAEIENELAQSQLGFFTPNQLELFPTDYFTGFISISSLPEMTREQVSRYKQLIATRTRRLVYFKQWQQHYNAHDKFLLGADEYALGGEWTTRAARVDPIQDNFAEQVQCRGEFTMPIWPEPATAESSSTVLQKNLAELQRVADERLDVIRGLEAACAERLTLIHELDATCRERLAVIEQFDAANRLQTS